MRGRIKRRQIIDMKYREILTQSCKTVKQFKKILLLGTVIVATTVFVFAAEASTRKIAAQTRMITDLDGRKVTIPVFPERVACFYGPSYEKVFLLGGADRVAMMSITYPPWAYNINPVLKDVQIMASYTSPNIEKMLQSKIDLVFYWTTPKQIETMTAAGIPVVCPYSSNRSPRTAEAFIRKYQDEVRFYGDVLGPENRKIADEYCSYFDTVMRNILSRTSAIPKHKRPKVYFSVGWNIFSTQGKYSSVHWQVDMAGGILVTADMESHFVNVTAEQIITWNPDIIIMGDMKPNRTVTDEPRFHTIEAVKNKQVYLCPRGVFHWGHGSSESILLLMFLAKTFHPELFEDIDMVN
ncbi:MAG: ABC transporter substrate-binding protein, partial [bacterium]|nr:ABC transporter substrate-binding protein [bacterium]